MATISGKFDTDTLKNLKAILWGTDIKDEVFMRWTQGKHILDFKNKTGSESKTTCTMYVDATLSYVLLYTTTRTTSIYFCLNLEIAIIITSKYVKKFHEFNFKEVYLYTSVSGVGIFTTDTHQNCSKELAMDRKW